MKTFKYQIEITGEEYSKTTVKSLLGKEAEYNSDFKEDCLVGEIFHDLCVDAITFKIQQKMDLLIKTKTDIKNMNEQDRSYWNYLEEKEQVYRHIQESFKQIKE